MRGLQIVNWHGVGNGREVRCSLHQSSLHALRSLMEALSSSIFLPIFRLRIPLGNPDVDLLVSSVNWQNCLL